MKREKELVKNTLIIFIGKICTQFLSFFLLPLYTKLLDSSQYGLVDLYTTYQTLIIYVVYAQIEQAFFRFLIDDRSNENNRKEISSTVITYYLLTSIILGLIFFIINLIFNIKYCFLLYLMIILCSLTNILLQYLRGLGDNVGYSLSSFICAISTVIANVIFLIYFHFGANGMLIGCIVGYIFSIIFMLFRTKLFRYYGFKFYNFITMKKLLLYSLPLIPNALSWWVMSASDKIVVFIAIGNTANGLLAVSLKFSTVYSNMYTMFHLSWTESASLNINEKDCDKFFSDIINSMIKLFGCIAIGIILIMPFIFGILIDSSYNFSYNLIPFYILSAFFNVIQGLYSVVYIALKKTKEIAKSTVVAAFINLFIDIVLIRFVGIYAAVISSIISYFVISVYRYIDIKKYINVPLNIKDIIVLLFLFVISLLNYFYFSKIINAVILVVMFFICVFINKNFIFKIIGIVMKRGHK